MTSPEVSWLFFKARAKRPYLSHTGRASNAEKQPTGPGPEGCDENGPAAALLVGHVSVQICSLLTPCRRPILIATKYLVFRGQDTRSVALNFDGLPHRPVLAQITSLMISGWIFCGYLSDWYLGLTENVSDVSVSLISSVRHFLAWCPPFRWTIASLVVAVQLFSYP